MSTQPKARPVAAGREESEAPAEQLRALAPVEVEWKQRIYDRLLKVLDLSLLGTLGEAPARAQIREITNRLFVEDCAPLSLAQRQFLVRRIEDEVMGNGPLEPLLKDPTVSDILVNGPQLGLRRAARQARADGRAVQR